MQMETLAVGLFVVFLPECCCCVCACMLLHHQGHSLDALATRGARSSLVTFYTHTYKSSQCYAPRRTTVCYVLRTSAAGVVRGGAIVNQASLAHARVRPMRKSRYNYTYIGMCSSAAQQQQRQRGSLLLHQLCVACAINAHHMTARQHECSVACSEHCCDRKMPRCTSIGRLQTTTARGHSDSGKHHDVVDGRTHAQRRPGLTGICHHCRI